MAQYILIHISIIPWVASNIKDLNLGNEFVFFREDFQRWERSGSFHCYCCFCCQFVCYLFSNFPLSPGFRTCKEIWNQFLLLYNGEFGKWNPFIHLLLIYLKSEQECMSFCFMVLFQTLRDAGKFQIVWFKESSHHCWPINDGLPSCFSPNSSPFFG